MVDMLIRPEATPIIREFLPFTILKRETVIREDASRRPMRVMRLTSLVQKADSLNENLRLYTEDVIKEALEALQPALKLRTVLGELDHPEDAKIHTENACILMTKCWMEGKNVYGQFEVLEGMPKGQMLKALINQGVTVSISSRGVGDMEPDIMEGSEVNKVLPGFRFVTFDAVNEPSVQGTALSITECRKRELAKNRSSKSKFEKQLLEATRSCFPVQKTN